MALVVEIDGVRYPEGTRFADSDGDLWEFFRDGAELPPPYMNVKTAVARMHAHAANAQKLADVYGPLTPEGAQPYGA